MWLFSKRDKEVADVAKASTSDAMTDSIRVSTLGLPDGAEEITAVYSTSCLSKHLIADLSVLLKNVTVGGELTAYQRLLDEGTKLALLRLRERAVELGAHGVCGLRFATPQVTGGASEIIAYGTAWKYPDVKQF